MRRTIVTWSPPSSQLPSAQPIFTAMNYRARSASPSTVPGTLVQPPHLMSGAPSPVPGMMSSVRSIPAYASPPGSRPRSPISAVGPPASKEFLGPGQPVHVAAPWAWAQPPAVPLSNRVYYVQASPTLPGRGTHAERLLVSPHPSPPGSRGASGTFSMGSAGAATTPDISQFQRATMVPVSRPPEGPKPTSAVPSILALPVEITATTIPHSGPPTLRGISPRPPDPKKLDLASAASAAAAALAETPKEAPAPVTPAPARPADAPVVTPLQTRPGEVARRLSGGSGSPASASRPARGGPKHTPVRPTRPTPVAKEPKAKPQVVSPGKAKPPRGAPGRTAMGAPATPPPKAKPAAPAVVVRTGSPPAGAGLVPPLMPLPLAPPEELVLSRQSSGWLSDEPTLRREWTMERGSEGGQDELPGTPPPLPTTGVGPRSFAESLTKVLDSPLRYLPEPGPGASIEQALQALRELEGVIGLSLIAREREMMEVDKLLKDASK